MRELKLAEVQAVSGGGGELYLLPVLFSFLSGVGHVGVIPTTFLGIVGCGFIGHLYGSSLKINNTTTRQDAAMLQDLKLLSIGFGLLYGLISGPIAYGIGTLFTRSEN